jgi:hypothetical protein
MAPQVPDCDRTYPFLYRHLVLGDLLDPAGGVYVRETLCPVQGDEKMLDLFPQFNGMLKFVNAHFETAFPDSSNSRADLICATCTPLREPRFCVRQAVRTDAISAGRWPLCHSFQAQPEAAYARLNNNLLPSGRIL